MIGLLCSGKVKKFSIIEVKDRVGKIQETVWLEDGQEPYPGEWHNILCCMLWGTIEAFWKRIA